MISQTHFLILALAGSVLGHSFAQGFEEKQQFRFYENSRIEYDSVRLHLHKSFSIVPGQQVVFEFTSDNAGDPGNHSRAESKVVFQIDPRVDGFHLRGEEIANHGGIYIQMCRCADKGVQTIGHGHIKGRKSVDGTWNVEIDVAFSGRNTGKEYHIRETGTFIAGGN